MVSVMQVLGATALIITAALGLVGIMSKYYRDNWFQFAGIVGTVYFSVQQAYPLLFSGTEISAQQFVIYASLACYAIGTAYKVRRGDYVRWSEIEAICATERRCERERGGQ